MKTKLKENLLKWWNEPRRFFFALALVGLCSLAIAAVIDQMPGGPASDNIRIVLFSTLCLVTATLLFVLAWIPPVRRFLERLLPRRLFALVCLATLVALFYAEENWCGQQAWKQFKRVWEAKGERFDILSVAPPPVPDDQNFAMAPIWVETICAILGEERGKVWYGDKVVALGHTNFTHRLAMPAELQGQGLWITNSCGGWQKGERPDLKWWQDHYRKLAAVTNYFPTSAQSQTPAQDVLLALSRYDSTIEELRQASKRPYSRFPVGYTDEDPASTLLPHLAPLKGCAMTLQWRAIAELQAGQTDKALADIELMWQLTDAVRAEPYLIAQLVRMAIVPIILQPVWEGLADHRWTDAQLAALEAELGRLGFLADYQLAMRGERAFSAGMIDFLRRHRNLDRLPFDDATARRLKSHLWQVSLGPSGWFDQNKVACCRMNFELLVPIVSVEARVVFPAAEARARTATERLGQRPFDWLAVLLVQGLSQSGRKAAQAQTSVDLARVACALERHRLASGSYPETLADLSPRFLERIPHDIIGGQPLKYRRTGDGAFVLYSIGWNEKDDGGAFPTTRPADSAKHDRYGDSDRIQEGDWVWRYPVK